jgi:GNAT superfamily N-acetyltransferase
MLQLVQITSTFPHFDQVEALDQEAFPAKEYLAPAAQIHLAEKGDFDFWALEEEGRFIGFMSVLRYEKLAYLFFLAIAKKERSKGYGGQALALFKAHYASFSHVVDMEKVDPNSSNAAQRILRQGFYQKNGYHSTGKCLRYLGVDYEIFTLEDSFDYSSFKRMMSQLDIPDFHPRYF